MKVSVTLLSLVLAGAVFAAGAAGTQTGLRRNERPGAAKRRSGRGTLSESIKTSRQWTSVGAPPRRKS